MYEERFIAFVDILGFGKLVETSSVTPDLPQKILDALLAMHPTQIQDELIITVNSELIPVGEVGRAREYARRLAKIQQEKYPVRINYFSDSLVLSARSDNVIASQMLLDLLSKISAMMWMSHRLLLRGGVTIGKLVHIQGGPMFGPAMNQAYLLESKKAVHPRFLIDSHCIGRYRKAETFELFESFIQEDCGYYYASLATAFRHILNDSSLAIAGEEGLRKFRQSMLEAPAEIEKLQEQFKDDDKIRPKYEWLAKELRARILEVNRPHPCKGDG